MVLHCASFREAAANGILGLILLTFFSIAVAATSDNDDGDDGERGDENFAFGLFSYAAQLLAVFREQISHRFISNSLEILGNVAFFVAALAIIVATTRAIREVPRLVRALTGRSRENEAMVEFEPISSTSHKLDEASNGKVIERVLDELEFVEFLDSVYKMETKLRTEWTSEIWGSLEEIEPVRPYTIPFTTRSSAKSFKWRNDRRADNEEAKEFGFLVATMVGVIVQIGFIVLMTVTIYFSPLRQRIKVQLPAYALPCYIIGSALFSVGLGFGTFIVERNSKQQTWTVLDKGSDTKGSRLDYFRKLRIINRKGLDGDRPDAGRKRKVASSARSTPFKTKNDTNGRDSILKWMTVVAGTAAVAGFTIQFIVLRGLAYPWSIAQISVLILMTLARAGVRRRLGRESEHGRVSTSDELDYLATHIVYCPHARQFETRGDTRCREDHSVSWRVNLPNLWNPNIPLPSARNQSPAGAKDGEQASKVDTATTGGVTRNLRRLVFLLSREPRTETAPKAHPRASSEQLLRVRQRLGDLCQWHLKTAYHASILRLSIETFMDAFFGGITSEEEDGGELEPNDLKWGIGVTGPNEVQDTIVVRLHKEAVGGKWRVDFRRIDALLSLWMADFENQLENGQYSAGSKWASRASRLEKHSFRRVLGNEDGEGTLARDLGQWIGDHLSLDHYPDIHTDDRPKDGQSFIAIGFTGDHHKDGSPETEPQRDDSKKLIVKGEDILPNIMIQHLFTSFMWFISRKLPKNCLPLSFDDEREVEFQDRTNLGLGSLEATRSSSKLSHPKLSALVQEVKSYGWGSRDDILLCIIPALSAHDRLPNPAIVLTKGSFVSSLLITKRPIIRSVSVAADSQCLKLQHSREESSRIVTRVSNTHTKWWQGLLETHAGSKDPVGFDFGKDVDIVVIGDRGFSESLANLDEKEIAVASALDTGQGESLAESLIKARVEAMKGFFIPHRTLRLIMTKERVRQSLSKSLPNHDSDITESLAEEICQAASTTSDEGSRGENSLRYLRLFAVLALIGKETEILSFIHAGYSDKDLPLSKAALEHVRDQSLGRKLLQTELGDRFEQEVEFFFPEQRADAQRISLNNKPEIVNSDSFAVDQPWSDLNIARFEAEQWCLLVPFFSQRQDPSTINHYSLQATDILPFLNNSSKQDTYVANGRLKIVTIHKEHNGFAKLQHPLQSDRFVIKSFDPTYANRKKRFTRELATLLSLARKSPEHFLSPLATYNLGESCSLVFPWAKSNLRQLWMEYPDPPQIDDIRQWVAAQLKGLATAIHTLHGGTREDPGSGSVHRRHGDLRPENVLFFPTKPVATETDFMSIITSGQLKVAGFDLASLYAKFSNKRTYRAPEYDLKHRDTLHAEDVWSLGAVFLESVTWALTGFSAMDTFTAARISDCPPDHPDGNYFIVEKNPTNAILRAEVKPSVTQWIDMLRKHPRQSPYYLRVLDLIQNGMLVVEEGMRFDALRCVEFLEDAAALINMSNTQGQESSQRLDPDIEQSLREEEDSNSETISTLEKERNSLSRLGISELRCEPIETVSKGVSILERVQVGVEWWVGERVDWSPLPPPNRYLLNAAARLTWEYGGQCMSICLNNKQYARYRDRFRARTPGILPTSQSTPGSALRAGNSSYLTAIWSSLSNSLHKQLRSWSKRQNRAAATAVPSTPATTLQAGTQKDSYFCTDRYWTSVKHTSVYTVASIDSLVDDYELFIRLRRCLATTPRPWFQRVISTRTCTRVQLSKFTFLFNESDMVKAFEHEHKAGIQTSDLCKGYEYSCIPDLDAAEHMQLMAEMILQGLQNPELGRGGQAVLTGIPKLECPPGLVKKQYSSGWGFYTRQGLSVKMIATWVVVIVSLGVTFIPVWLGIVDSLDVQTSLAPLSAMASILSLALTVIIGIEALAPRS